LRTLGGAALCAEPGGASVLGPGKPLALLVFLAFAPGRRASRESLIDLLWSDLEPERARPALRQSLFHLRRVVGDDAIAGTEELTLSRCIDSDRDRFLAAIDRGELDDAVELYQGDFLPAFGVPGGAAFEHWADLERRRLQSSFIRCAELLVRRHLNESRSRDARRIARAVRDLAPNEEAAWRLVLESAIAGSDFVGAAVEANALEEWAAAEQVVLEPATRTAITRARRVAPPTAEDKGASRLMAELTGREREFFAITTAWDAVRSGPARHLHLSAPAGFGKSRLLRDALARLAATGAPMVQLRGTPGDRDVPYAFAGDLAAALVTLPGAAGVAPASAATLLALNPALSAWLSGTADTAAGEEALRRRIHALTDLVQSVAHEQRFVLAIDDLHWVDAPSFRVVEGMLGRLNEAHVLCLTASRPERAPGDERCTEVPLPALSVEQVGGLVAALGTIPADGTWSASFVAGLHAATRGSPLLVLETLQLALDQGALTLDGTEWRCLDANRLASLLKAGEALRERVRALPGAQGSVLSLLAIAGIPLDDDVLASAAGISREELSVLTGPLERHGLAARTSAGWMPAHDEIADAARAGLSDAQRTSAERRVGEYFARVAGDDLHGIIRATRHFTAADDAAAVQRLCRRYVQLARERGDRRPYAQLAAELIGADASSPRVAALVKTLPRAWRAGLWSRTRQLGAAAVFILAPSLGAGALWMRSASEASLQRLVFADSAGTVRMIAMRDQEWDGRNTPLDATRGSTALADAALGFQERPPAISPDGRSAAWTQDSGDSTTLDIWIRTPGGTRRLTREYRDDVVLGWLPDGSALVGTTNRWSPVGDGDYDIAIFDTATGAARQVTRGPSHDTSPTVSPDGTRIAFIRESSNDAPQLCVTLISGNSEPECRMVDGQPIGELLGWVSPVELALVVSEERNRPLVIYDWPRKAKTEILGPHVVRARLSPDRRWIAAAVRKDGIRGVRDWVVPVGRPNQARPVAGASGVRWWEGPFDRSLLIDRLEFADSATLIPYGLGTRFRVRPLTAANGELPLYAPVTWTSSDTLVATVDSTGEVRPRSGGTVTVTASLAGWRSVSRALRIGGEPSTTIMTEQWDGEWAARWLPWGEPAPRVVAGPGGIRGFDNNGDGSYYSMAVLRRALSARQGLGMEVRLSTPLTRFKWQRLHASIVSGIDTAALRAADQAKAPPSLGRSDAACGITFPTDGRWGATRITVIGSISQLIDLAASAAPLRSGAWWTLRLQILPDGRCGVAINNRVIWLSPEPIPLNGEFRVRLGDSSAGTTLLHGPLTIWTGVRTDIDWTRHE
jgi:DNA-binding SARP family transcriptional activator